MALLVFGEDVFGLPAELVEDGPEVLFLCVYCTATSAAPATPVERLEKGFVLGLHAVTVC